MKKFVDLNSDVGESFGAYKIGLDEEVLSYVSSANIACGWHAGDPIVMSSTVRAAFKNGVGIGAHPGFFDIMGFGRRNMTVSTDEMKQYTIYQLGALYGFVKAAGAKMQHVKPHGAMYNPMIMELAELIGAIKSIISRMHELKLPEAKVIEIPTLYGGEYGPDIEFVADHNKISIDEVIKIHTDMEYLIYMIGFTPGFPYLGGMSDKIQAPRLQNPRTKIPFGSVGIAGKQTGIYPVESPGGWQLIGRTPVKLYDPCREDPVLLNAGDYIKFVQIDENEYKNIEDLEREGKYKVIIREK